MPVNEQIPDYDLDDMVVVTAPEQLRALADPLRTTLLELLLERAATVTEMARAVDRPKSTIAYHVNLLVDAGLLRVVRTRRVRAIEERYYGRVARTLYIGMLNRPEDRQVAAAVNGLAEAAAESGPAHVADQLRCTLVHARIPIEEVRSFWGQVQELARRFAQIPRAGDQVYGFVEEEVLQWRWTRSWCMSACTPTWSLPRRTTKRFMSCTRRRI
jgi:DNA-binding transcriptional ArsR family regulator